MSDTRVDMAKVTQMLDSGWNVTIYKGPLGSYEVRAFHPNPLRMAATKKQLIKGMRQNRGFLSTSGMTPEEAVDEMDYHDHELMTDDFTPEQALTRMAYKTFGEIL